MHVFHLILEECTPCRVAIFFSSSIIVANGVKITILNIIAYLHLGTVSRPPSNILGFSVCILSDYKY